MLILLNVLISLFASAYSDVGGSFIDFMSYNADCMAPPQVVEDAEAQYLAFFAGKTISMIRAPDSYVYPAPFNLIELVFVAPFE